MAGLEPGHTPCRRIPRKGETRRFPGGLDAWPLRTRAGRRCITVSAMTRGNILSGGAREFAVIWRDSADPGRIYSGELALGSAGVRLRGGAGDVHVVRDVRAGEVATVADVEEDGRLAGCPSLRVDLRDGTRLLVAHAAGRGHHLLEFAAALTSLAVG